MMNKDELDEIYYQLEEVTAILWLFSNLNDGESINQYICCIASHYVELLEQVQHKISKYL